MFFRTISILALLTISSNAIAEETPADTPKTEAAPATEASAPEQTEASPETTTGDKPEATTGENTEANTENTEGDGDQATDGEADTQEPVTQEPITQEPVTETKSPSTPEVAEDAHAGGHAGQFTVEEMWNQSSGPVRAVLGTLLFMLVAAMGVGLERLITLGSARSQSRKLAGEVGTLLNDGKMKEALAVCARDDMKKSYLGHLLAAGLKEFESREDQYGIDAVERAIEKNAITETASLNKGLNILATVGSTAPFVGLVGTIFGIINAFGQIGAEGGADLTTLAPAIGEALITTAFGIIVAIVGVWLFNYFTAMIGSISNDMAESSQELVDWCYKRIRPAQVDKSAK